MNKTIATTLLICSMIALAPGCKNNRRDWTQPEEATPEYLAAQLDRSNLLVRDALRHEVAGHTEQALEKYQQAIAAYNDNPTAWHNSGILLARKNRNLEAATAFKTASELSPTDPRPLYELGLLWDNLGYLDDAARWYDEALQRDPHHQNSLRRSILVDELRHRLTPTTAERLKVAILAEREPWWVNRFKRIQQLMAEGDTFNSDRSPSTYAVPEPAPVHEPASPGLPAAPAQKPPATPEKPVSVPLSNP